MSGFHRMNLFRGIRTWLTGNNDGGEGLTPGSPAFRTSVAAFSLVGAAVFLLWLYKAVLVSRPYWAAPTSTEVIYFLNSYGLASGEIPGFILHPGTPVQVLGAGIVTVLDAGFDNVQQFLTFGYIVSLIVTLLALAYLAFRTLRGMPLFLGHRSFAYTLRRSTNPGSVGLLG